MATAVETLDKDAFNQLVLEEGLRTWAGEMYIYTGKHGKKGWEIYRTRCGTWDSVPVTAAATADPAAGANPAAVTVPAGKKWKLFTARCQLVADATVVNRNALVTVTDGTTTVAAFRAAFNQTASTTVEYTFCDAYPTTTLLATAVVSYSPLELPAGYTFQVTFLNLQAGDNATAASYTYKEVDA